MINNIEFIYAGCEILEFIGEEPNLKIKLNILVSYRNNVNDKIYIPTLNFKVKLCSAETLKGSYKDEGMFGIFKSNELFFEANCQANFLIPINEERYKKMQSIRAAQKLVAFFIEVEYNYSLYDKTSKQYSEFSPYKSQVMKMMPDSLKSESIILSTEEFNDIVKNIKHFEIFKLEIPISNINNNSSNKRLQQALVLLDSAKNNLIENNYHKALLDLRNILINHLFMKVDDGKGNMKNVLKDDIEKTVIENVPTSAITIYKNIMENHTKALNSLLQNLNAFVHTDSDKLILSPMPQDVETIYFVTAHLVKYLTSYT